MDSLKVMYARYLVKCENDQVKPKSLTSFKNRAALAKELGGDFDGAAVAPKKGAKAKGDQVEIAVSLTKVQRAIARRYYAKHDLERPQGWHGASIPAELATKLGI